MMQLKKQWSSCITMTTLVNGSLILNSLCNQKLSFYLPRNFLLKNLLSPKKLWYQNQFEHICNQLGLFACLWKTFISALILWYCYNEYTKRMMMEYFYAIHAIKAGKHYSAVISSLSIDIFIAGTYYFNKLKKFNSNEWWIGSDLCESADSQFMFQIKLRGSSRNLHLHWLWYGQQIYYKKQES